MQITHCKFKKSIQRKLIEFFVLEVTARSAARCSVPAFGGIILGSVALLDYVRYYTNPSVF